MPAGESFTRHVVARLFDFFDDSTHWQRRLWNVGLTLSLREVVEACEASRDRALDTAAVAWLVESTRKKVFEDPGAGGTEQRKALADALRGAPQAEGVSHRVIQVALSDIRDKYLSRWRDELETSDSPPGRERTARALASHLLDAGLPGPYLRTWLSDLVTAHGLPNLADLLTEAERLSAQPQTKHQVLVLFEREPVSRAARPMQWVDSARAARWLQEHGVTSRPRQRGGLLLDVDAYGPDDAVERAVEQVDRFTARVAVGTRSEAAFHPEAVVAGFGAYPLRRRRRVEVRALEREDRVFQLTSGDLIDAALQLLSHLSSGPRAPAVAGGWSAIEILLRAPGDTENVAAADRLAVLTACSWPRAELTDLAWSWVRQGDDDVATDLRRKETNREKAQVVADAISGGKRFDFASPSDVAAVHRMEEVLASPQKLLFDVRDHVAESLRRLYRQRNLVMHGGRIDAVALEASSAHRGSAGWGRRRPDCARLPRH